MEAVTRSSGGGKYGLKTLAKDLKPAGVIALVLHPGWVKTDMGGPHALISSMRSVGMREVISRLTIEDSGRFVSFDGKAIPW